MNHRLENGFAPPQPPVLVVGEYGVLNGGERSFLTVAERLIAGGWNYVAAVPRNSPFEKALQTIGVRNVGLNTHLPDGGRLSQVELRDQIAGLVDDVQPCLIHANSLSMSRIVGPLEVGVPSVGVFRPLAGEDELNTEDDVQRAATVQQLRSEFGFALDDRVLLYVGQIGMRKGIRDLAEIFLRSAQRVAKLKLLVVGERHSTKAEAAWSSRGCSGFDAVGGRSDSSSSARTAWKGVVGGFGLCATDRHDERRWLG